MSRKTEVWVSAPLTAQGNTVIEAVRRLYDQVATLSLYTLSPREVKVVYDPTSKKWQASGTWAGLQQVTL